MFNTDILKENLLVDVSGLLEPQKDHVVNLVNGILKYGFASDLSETGTGKTYSAAAVARFFNEKKIIVCPKNVIPSWNKVLIEMGVSNYVILNYEMLIRGKNIYCKKVSMNDIRLKKTDNPPKDMLEWQIDANDHIIIFDESHKCKGMKSSTSELLLNAFEKKIKFLTVSATQAMTPMDMFIYGYVLDEHNLMGNGNSTSRKSKTFYDWAREFGGDWKETRDGFDCDVKADKALIRMKTLHDKLFNEGYASRLKKSDMKGFFPDNHIMANVFDMGKNGQMIADIFDEMEREIDQLMQRGYADHIFAVMIKARRKAELLKAPSIVEEILKHYEEGKSIAVFVNFRDTVASIVERVEEVLGKNVCALVVGGQKNSERQNNIEEFQDNVKRIIVCNMAAGGVGISLHDLSGTAPRVSIISPSWSACQFVQALGRIWRANAQTTCLQYVMYCAGTIEEEIAVRVNGKLGNLDALNDGDLTKNYYGLPDSVKDKINDDYFEEYIEEMTA